MVPVNARLRGTLAACIVIAGATGAATAAERVPGMPGSTVTGALRTVTESSDAVVRRTDPCGALSTCGPTPIAPFVNLPDLRMARLGTWSPANAFASLYSGAYDEAGDFLRVELVFAGLVNPPGPMLNTYDPHRHGASPVVGFIEFDVDTNGNSGGNIDAPLLRYNGNVARFGGLPAGSIFAQRISTDGRDPDNASNTPPWIERSGADFEIELRGDDVVGIEHVDGDADLLFEANETWIVEGHFFRRTRGYDNCAGGGYEPVVALRFAHCGAAATSAACAAAALPVDNLGSTLVTLVYPLTNAAYAAAHGINTESDDVFDFNANSVLEALQILNNASAAELCPSTYEWAPLIDPWRSQDPLQYLQPQWWRATMLLGTARTGTVVGEGNYIWTDTYPDVVPGDVNGDGYKSRSDRARTLDFIGLRDGQAAYDADAASNGVVEIVNHGVWFSLFDVDYDGFVDSVDVAFAEQAFGDFDNEGDVDLRDCQALQRCVASATLMPGLSVPCRDAFDADNDGVIDAADLAAFAAALSGPETGEE